MRIRGVIELNVTARIREMIAERGLKQSAVAKRAGFTEQQFSDMLNGRKVIRAEYLPRIADALGIINIGDLFVEGQDIA